MNREDALTVLEWLCGGLNHRMDEIQEGVWLAEIMPLDAQAALDTALSYTRMTPRPRFPSTGEFRQAVRFRLGQQQEQKLPPAEDVIGKFGSGAAPRWVRVWQWLRSQGDWRTLPQQAQHAIPDISSAEYQEIEARWAKETENGAKQPRWGPLAGMGTT